MALLFPALLLILMYVLLIRPQQQRVRRQRALVQSLEVGDRVVSIGGIIGHIISMDDETMEVEVTDGVVLTFLRGAISRKLDESDAGSGVDEADDEELDIDGDDVDLSNDAAGVDDLDERTELGTIDAEPVNHDKPEGDR